MLKEITLLTAILTGQGLAERLGQFLGRLDLGHTLWCGTDRSCLELRCLLKQFLLLFLLLLMKLADSIGSTAVNVEIEWSTLSQLLGWLDCDTGELV